MCNFKIQHNSASSKTVTQFCFFSSIGETENDIENGTKTVIETKYRDKIQDKYQY